MNLTLIGSLLALGLFFGMLLFLEFGRRLGLTRLARDPDGLAKGTAAAEGAIFGLLGLVLAFSFSDAADRFEQRRHLVTQEANAIGTAYLRLDLLPAASQLEIRALFRRYLDVRSMSYQDAQDGAATQARLDETAKLQGMIWSKAVAASQAPGASVDATKLLLPMLNDVIDITTTRRMATRNHPPLVIFLLLAGLSWGGALLLGYDMSGNKDRSWFHWLAFATMISLATYVIVDLEFPYLGLVRVDAADQVLVELRSSIDEPGL